MTEEQIVEAPRATVYYERKVGLPEYGNVVAGIHIQVPTSPGDDLEQIASNAKAAFFDAKALVYQELGIVSALTEENILVEKAARQLGAVSVNDAAAPARSDHTAGSNSKDALWEDLQNNPKNWYDNRVDKKNPKGPDFKQKAGAKEALWLKYQGKSVVPEGITVPDASAF